MNRYLVLLLVLNLARTASAAPSAIRDDGENFEQAAQRQLPSLRVHKGIEAIWKISAYSSKADFGQLNLTSLPVWDHLDVAFAVARDERYLEDPAFPGFPRRPTWLYPDDGCYARAEVTADRMQKLGYARPAKIFIFGNLSVATANSPAGTVSWWYHVAPIVTDGKDPYVIDPAISPQHPLKLQEWILTMVPSLAEASYAICDSHAYDPQSACLFPSLQQADATQVETSQFLDAEWNRLLELGRSPEKELGEHPPWKR